MVHRALLGSIERFAALLIEHYQGAFPTWLAPVEVPYAAEVAARLRSDGVRVELDDGGDRMGNKIRRAEQALKPPYILVIGKRAAAAGEVAVRARGRGDLGPQPLEGFLAQLDAEVRRRGGA